MKRSDFLKLIIPIPLIGATMKLSEWSKLGGELPNTDKMPVLFLGHGSPMNAIEENDFVKGFRTIGSTIPKPKAILCVSAHWETRGTFVTAMEKPKTIHDFGGFPQQLFEVQYPASGSPELAKETQQIVSKTTVGLDQNWGLDHGCWSVVKHLYPNADVPVVQMSLDFQKNPQYHYELAQQLATLRQKGVLIIGSGNIVHNLGMVAWDKLDKPGYGYDWAIETHETVNRYIAAGNHEPIINYSKQGKAMQLAVPTPEHFLPLLYVLGLQEKGEKVTFYNDSLLAGSLSMTSVKVG
jgi:4,5-DOPA dioxygenase extradiol